MIATASPFTGFQPIAKLRTLSNGAGQNGPNFDKDQSVLYGVREPSVANSLLSFSGILQTT
jgi:hypothetical protein